MQRFVDGEELLALAVVENEIYLAVALVARKIVGVASFIFEPSVSPLTRPAFPSQDSFISWSISEACFKKSLRCFFSLSAIGFSHGVISPIKS